MPLLFSAPDGPQGFVSEDLVSLINIMPTVLKLQGIDLPESFQGSVFAEYGGEARQEVFSEYGSGGPLLTQEDPEELPQPLGRDAFFQCLRRRKNEGERRLIRTTRYKYVTDPLGDRDELYNLREDPREFENRARLSEYTAIKSELRNRVESHD